MLHKTYKGHIKDAECEECPPTLRSQRFGAADANPTCTDTKVDTDRPPPPPSCEVVEKVTVYHNCEEGWIHILRYTEPFGDLASFPTTAELIPFKDETLLAWYDKATEAPTSVYIFRARRWPSQD